MDANIDPTVRGPRPADLEAARIIAAATLSGAPLPDDVLYGLEFALTRALADELVARVRRDRARAYAARSCC